MMYKENYSVHGLLKFRIVNYDIKSLLNSFNPEYSVFKVKDLSNPDFIITVAKSKRPEAIRKGTLYRTSKRFKKWTIDIIEFESGFIDLWIIPHFKGVRKIAAYSAIKNLYVRSLISLVLLKKDNVLVHANGFSINNKACLMAGRPGVFKTSILMDVLRLHKGSFIGEENVLLVDGLLYSFPLNMDSIAYKVKYFEDENASSKFQKVKLGISLLTNDIKNSDQVLNIASEVKPVAVAYVTKSEKFKVLECDLKEILPHLVENEMQEFSIPPTHTLSKIKYNYFMEILNLMNPMYKNEIKTKIENIIKTNIQGCKYYRITTPYNYKKSITEDIINQLLI